MKKTAEGSKAVTIIFSVLYLVVMLIYFYQKYNVQKNDSAIPAFAATTLIVLLPWLLIAIGCMADNRHIVPLLGCCILLFYAFSTLSTYFPWEGYPGFGTLVEILAYGAQTLAIACLIAQCIINFTPLGKYYKNSLRYIPIILVIIYMICLLGTDILLLVVNKDGTYFYWGLTQEGFDLLLTMSAITCESAALLGLSTYLGASKYVRMEYNDDEAEELPEGMPASVSGSNEPTLAHIDTAVLPQMIIPSYTSEKNSGTAAPKDSSAASEDYTSLLIPEDNDTL